MADKETEKAPRSKLKRAGGLVLIILSIIVLVLNVAGIVGAWAVNEPLTDSIVGILEPVEETLELAGDLLDRISAGVERARGVVSTIDTAAELLGDNIEENRPLLNLISKALGDELGPVIENVGEIVSTARAAATTIQKALEIVDGLPFVSLGEGGLETTRIENMANRVSDVAASLEELDTSVEDRRSEAAEEIVGRITSRTSEISAFLDDLQSEVDGYRAQIGDLQTRVATVKARVPLWIDLGSIGITLLFVWLGLSQVSVFIHGWSFFKGEDLLARWR